jgi:purine-binding chemotaxis protein CheW
MATESERMDQAFKAMGSKEGKYLTFSLAGEEYGIGILKVKEIIGMMPITTVPRAPASVKGVINLRGKVIPVMDLRLKFGMEETAYTERTCIIVAETKGESGVLLIGIVVDSVSEVLNIKAADIEETPAFGARMNMDYILGMAKSNGGVKILLNIDRVLGEEDVTFLDQAA